MLNTSEPTKRKFYVLLTELRPFHWSKNLLLFLPLLMAHKIMEIDLLLNVLWGVICFSLIASAGYVINDLFDWENDKNHPIKRKRPLSLEIITKGEGKTLIIILTVFTVLGCYFIGNKAFSQLIIIYFSLSVLYTIIFKKIDILDIIILSVFYTIRIISGGILVGVEISSWLLIFSTFFFISLACLKRYIDFKISKKQTTSGGYSESDSLMIQLIGINSGLISILVLAFYIQSDHIRVLYRHPEILWSLVPVFVYWISNIWLNASRGVFTNDPVISFLKDGRNYIVLLIIVVIFTLAKFWI